MQRRIIFNKFTGSWVISSLMVIATTVSADSYFSQQYPQYPPRDNAGQSSHRQTNPWLLPQTQEKSPEFQTFPTYQSQHPQENQPPQETQAEKQSKNFRFVTPEILDSLKQQQTQSQLMPGNEYNQQNLYRRSARGRYGYSPYGLGYTDTIYDLPAVSPWGIGPDVLYRGQSYPLVPNEAIGGIPPIPMSSFDENSYQDELDNTENQKYEVFNPFTLLPNGN
jgi:hypothetical protein